MPDERILVLEDDANLRGELYDVLEEEGFRVDAVGQGEEAVRRILASPYDLLVADVRMEGIDGLEAVARLRQQEASVPVLVITGYVSETDSIRAIRLGVGDYLRKPFRQEEFISAVLALLARTALAREQNRRETELREICAALADLDTPAARLARHLGHLLGLDAHRRLLAQLACGSAALPARLEELARHVQERWDGSGPQGLRGEEIRLEARVAALARTRSQQADLTLERFLELHRGQFDPYLPELLEAPEGKAESLPGLLALGGTLAELGDESGAREILDQVLQQAPVGQARVEALLLLARLERSGERLREAVDSARGLGPRLLAECQRRAGLLALEIAPELARVWLRESHDQLSDPLEQAQVRLAWQSLEPDPTVRPDDLRLLLAPQHELLRLHSLAWLLPLLWRTARAQAEQLVAEYPTTAARLVARGQLPAGLPVEAGAPALTLRSFGVFQVLAGEQPVDERAWRGSRVKHLLAYLAASETPVHEERVLDLFWSDGTEKGRRGLSSALSVLRRALPKDGDYLPRRGDLLTLNPERVRWHDLADWQESMRAAAQSASANREAEAVEHWRAAVNLYTGPYLEGCYMDWALERRTRIENETLEACLRVGRADLAGERFEAALQMADGALRLDDCSQEAQLISLRALQGLGRPEQAVRRFEQFQRTLHRELGLEPSLELLECYHRARLSLA